MTHDDCRGHFTQSPKAYFKVLPFIYNQQAFAFAMRIVHLIQFDLFSNAHTHSNEGEVSAPIVFITLT